MQRGQKTHGGKRAGAGRKPKTRPVCPSLAAVGQVLAKRLRQAWQDREKELGHPLALRDLAEASGTSEPTLRRVLAGQGNLRANALVGLAAVLRVRAGWLLGE